MKSSQSVRLFRDLTRLLSRTSLIALGILANLLCQTSTGIGQDLPRLKVSDNHRYLVSEKGAPFFWLGDTAWELFHRLNREETLEYLDLRAKQGYNVIQAVALAEENGINDPNRYDHKPLIDNDPTKPNVAEGPANDYWDHVDFVVTESNKRGIYVGMLPTWGDKWNKKWGQGPEIFTAKNAEVYGKWIANRYKNAGIVWILGGDRPVENEAHKEITRAMSRGIREGDGGTHLISWHPTGGNGSSDLFHHETWLDFNMRQNGHEPGYTGRYDSISREYALTPTKPILDAEPIYEDHPVSFDAKKHGHSISSDIRRPFYWDVFSGAFGHTYGHHSVWQFASDRRPGVNNPLMPWREAIHQPGAAQMGHGRALMESRPFLTRVPDDTIIVAEDVPTSVPGAGRYRFVGTRDTDGTYAMVYAPVGRPFQVRMDVIRGAKVKAWWFNPRNGKSTPIGDFSNVGTQKFVTPDPGEMLDWVLVIDDAAKNYPAPGEKLR